MLKDLARLPYTHPGSINISTIEHLVTLANKDWKTAGETNVEDFSKILQLGVILGFTELKPGSHQARRLHRCLVEGGTQSQRDIALQLFAAYRMVPGDISKFLQ